MKMIVISHHMSCTTFHVGKAKTTCRLSSPMQLDYHTLLIKLDIASLGGGAKWTKKRSRMSFQTSNSITLIIIVIPLGAKKTLFCDSVPLDYIVIVLLCGVGTSSCYLLMTNVIKKTLSLGLKRSRLLALPS
jgi:hypothetical protein